MGVQLHQATGMIKEQLGTTIEGAFLALRARSFSSGRSLTELANDIVTRRTRFTAENS